MKLRFLLYSGFLGMLLMGASCTREFKIPKQAHIANNRCVIFVSQNKLELAEQSAKLALEYYEQFAHPWNCLGTVELRRGDLDKAERYFKKAIHISTNFVQARNNLGHVYLVRKRYKRAKSEFFAARRIDPENRDARYNLALAYVKLRDWKNARSELVRLVLHHQHRNYAPGHFLLGFVEFERKNWMKAAQHHFQAVKLDRNYKHAHLGLASALFNMKKYWPACLSIKNALNLDPRFVEADNLRKGIDGALRKQGKTCPKP